ncbi:MAG: DUF3160 domain-containing protein [candidate division KSB1 bacterium]|nr:DUF3160 domain-containing protein [candidate division KSB1 bacterium]
MKTLLVLLSVLCPIFAVRGQNHFDPQTYKSYLASNQDKSASQLIAEYAPDRSWYTDMDQAGDLNIYSFLDSIQDKYGLTADERELLTRNRFVVSERLSFHSMGHALHDVYAKDLPVFISSDAVLHALHCSYDNILMELEVYVVEPRLIQLLNDMHAQLPTLAERYADEPVLNLPLQDADLYLAVARSLLAGESVSPRLAPDSVFRAVMTAIDHEKAVDMPLFSERARHLDFSQFTVRGHYNQKIYTMDGVRTLENYFKAMMWLGRIELWLTPPPENPWEAPWSPKAIQRMGLAGVLINELVDEAGQRKNLNKIDRMIRFLVGESDNLTPAELHRIQSNAGMASARDLVDLQDFEAFQGTLESSDAAQQKILSNMIMMDPFDPEPGTLSVSFRLLGQRFIVDSYVFANVVFDRIVFNNKKVWRPLPDPLDAMFVLGNDNAAPLLQDELQRYQYASQLSALRYLVDYYPDEFWIQSLYNAWLQGIRDLSHTPEGVPLFMQSTAWQQKTLNTQLASWAQLRHDNLLYAKQSYTGMTGCSYPHSFVEPVPDMFAHLEDYAKRAAGFFNSIEFPDRNPGFKDSLLTFYGEFGEICSRLQGLAEKELNGSEFSGKERDWLQRMLFRDGGSGRPPYSGWYADLYYDTFKAGEPDYVIADVHTQPTDQAGNPVGHVLHVSVGRVNLGVILTQSDTGTPMAFCGPFLSYYEQVSRDFKRYTDQEWAQQVEDEKLPQRPDWVNIYLANHAGQKRVQGRELTGQMYTGEQDQPVQAPTGFAVYPNHPNPFNPVTQIHYRLPSDQHVQIAVYNSRGQCIKTLINERQAAGAHQVIWNAYRAASGVYIARVSAGEQVKHIKMMLVK